MIRLEFPPCPPYEYVIFMVGVGHELVYEVFADGLPTVLTFVGLLLATKGTSTFL